MLLGPACSHPQHTRAPAFAQPHVTPDLPVSLKSLGFQLSEQAASKAGQAVAYIHRQTDTHAHTIPISSLRKLPDWIQQFLSPPRFLSFMDDVWLGV